MSLPDRDNAAHASSVRHEEMGPCTSSVGRDDGTLWNPVSSISCAKVCELNL